MRRTENTETVMINDDVEQIVDPQFHGISKPVVGRVVDAVDSVYGITHVWVVDRDGKFHRMHVDGLRVLYPSAFSYPIGE